tara:strand:- start:328 stop:471 length:144 start_codon:yes stop_codon:yes gene_type:complete
VPLACGKAVDGSNNGNDSQRQAVVMNQRAIAAGCRKQIDNNQRQTDQ